jgi:hypothetical protein
MSAPDLNESVVAREVRGQPALPDDLHPRHLARRLVEIAGFIALVVIALSAFPNLEEVRIQLESADPVWITLLVVAEIGSCAGYMLVFRATFCSRMPWGLSYDISMAELAADSLLPAGGAGVSPWVLGRCTGPGCRPATSRGAASRSSSSPVRPTSFHSSL